jgi:DNA-binding MarR family transcriptional regulator
MKANSVLYDFLVDNLKTFFFPEDWLELDLNFSKTELMALMVVDRYGEVSMSQICDALNIPMSTSTGIVDRMVKKGFLHRERSDIDRRVVVVAMTERGREVFRYFRDMLTGYLEQIESALTEEEKQLLYRIFTKIIAVINSEKEPEHGGEEAAPVNKIDIE